MALIIKLIVINSGMCGKCEAPINSTADRVFINKIFEYSARKNRANGPPAYSTLKPETNSDSPSVKSKGARFVSARVEIYHIAARGHAGANNQMLSWVVLNVCSV